MPETATDPIAPFSAATRARSWARLAGEEHDLLVVGGGITGVAAARDAAGRGLRVALLEAGDFAEGTSSRSSRLVHGGLRYLETFDFGLVFEALAERARLLELAPHLVRPLPFLFPVYHRDDPGFFKLWAGMWVYDALSLFRGTRLHRMLGARGAQAREPGMRRDGLAGGAVYYDAQVDDARLTLEVARGAHEAGAALVTHAPVVRLLLEGGRVRGAVARDAASGEEREVRARLVLNATGPWSDALRRLADPGAPPRLRTTKGVHLVLPAERVGNRGAIIFRSHLDGRVMFVLPWGSFTYVGTTDTDFPGDAGEAEADRDDVSYLLDSVNHLFPDARLANRDVVSTWSGVRPLLAPRAANGRTSASRTSREHEIWRDPSGLLNVAGGKLTTFRSMAAEVVREAARVLEAEHGVRSGEFYTEYLPLPGAPEEAWESFRLGIAAEAGRIGIPAATADHLAAAYGAAARDVLLDVREDPALARPLLPPLPYLWAEVRHAVRREMAVTLEDVLRRRLHLLYEAPDGGVAVAREVALHMAREAGIGWDEAEVERQVERYRAAVEATRAALR